MANTLFEALFPAYGMKESVPGTWNVKTGNNTLNGIINYLNPFSRDYGYTELSNVGTGRSTTNPVTNNPAVYKAAGGVPSGQNTSTLPWISPGQTNLDTTYYTINGETKKGSDWVSEGVDPNNPNGSAGNPSQDAVLQARLNGIMQRLGLMRGEGERLRGVAKGVRDEIFKNADERYGSLARDTQQKRNDSMVSYDTADKGIISDYATTQEGMNRAAESAKLKNRALARALGYGGSFYDNMQTGNNNMLADNTAKLSLERAAKLGDIKTGLAGVDSWYGDTISGINRDNASVHDQADAAYQDNVAKSILAEQNFGIDQVDQAAQAEADYADRLAKVDSYVNPDAQKQRLNAIANVVANRSKEIGGTPNIDAGTASNLAYQPSLNTAATQKFDTVTAPSWGDNQNTTGTLMATKKKKNPWDEWLYA